MVCFPSLPPLLAFALLLPPPPPSVHADRPSGAPLASSRFVRAFETLVSRDGGGGGDSSVLLARWSSWALTIPLTLGGEGRGVATESRFGAIFHHVADCLPAASLCRCAFAPRHFPARSSLLSRLLASLPPSLPPPPFHPRISSAMMPAGGRGTRREAPKPPKGPLASVRPSLRWRGTAVADAGAPSIQSTVRIMEGVFVLSTTHSLAFSISWSLFTCGGASRSRWDAFKVFCLTFFCKFFMWGDKDRLLFPPTM